MKSLLVGFLRLAVSRREIVEAWRVDGGAFAVKPAFSCWPRMRLSLMSGYLTWPRNALSRFVVEKSPKASLPERSNRLQSAGGSRPAVDRCRVPAPAETRPGRSEITSWVSRGAVHSAGKEKGVANQDFLGVQEKDTGA